MPPVSITTSVSRSLELLAANTWSTSGEDATSGGGEFARIDTAFDRSLGKGEGFGSSLLGALRSLGEPLAVTPKELHGLPDGPPLKLPSGIVVERQQLNGARVSQGELVDAVRGINALPTADQQLIAQQGVSIKLLPTARLEDDLLGATRITQAPGQPWRPAYIRVAVRANRGGDESTTEITQHEIGHAISVMRTGDVTEAAAETYAAQY